jgi:hypothetical protein
MSFTKPYKSESKGHQRILSDISIINYNRISWAISSFDVYKSPGPEGIFPALLQQGKEDLVPVLGRLYGASLAIGHVPTVWKSVEVVFIPKRGRNSYAEAKAFRPIAYHLSC